MPTPPVLSITLSVMSGEALPVTKIPPALPSWIVTPETVGEAPLIDTAAPDRTFSMTPPVMLPSEPGTNRMPPHPWDEFGEVNAMPVVFNCPFTVIRPPPTNEI